LALAETNPISSFPITVDGQFTDGVSGGVLSGEWSDVTPKAFISPPTDSGQLLEVPVGDPRANSLLYAAVAPGAFVVGHELYLMYDYLPRTNPIFAPGEFIADVKFPIQPFPSATCPQCDGLTKFPATVEFRGTGGSSFDVSVEVQGLPGVFSASDFDMEGAIGFGPSTLSTQDHLLVELEVGLNTPAGFFDPNSPPGTGPYSPDPAFWSAGISNNQADPMASAAFFHILPGGANVITSDPNTPFVPEPSTFCLIGVGIVGGWAIGRRYRRAA
jgi:hypothetical protein